jgi:hypothetical protein
VSLTGAAWFPEAPPTKPCSTISTRALADDEQVAAAANTRFLDRQRSSPRVGFREKNGVREKSGEKRVDVV